MEEQTEQREAVSYTYESSEIFLSMVQAEYQNEIERAASIDTKLSISLPIIATYLFSIVQYSGLRILDSMVENMGIRAFYFILIYGLALAFGSASCVQMVMSIVTHQYETVDMNKLNSARHISMPREQYCAAVSARYIHAAFRNALQNDKRGKLHTRGWISAAVSLACFSLFALAAREGGI